MQTTTNQPAELAADGADVADYAAHCLAAIRAINPIGALLIFSLGFTSAAIGMASAVVGLSAALVCLAFLGGLYLDRRQVETAAAKVTPAAAALFSAQAKAIAAQAAAAVGPNMANYNARCAALAASTSPPPLPSSAAIVAAPAWPNVSGLPGGLVVSQITLKQPAAERPTKAPRAKVTT